jgi:cell shape-determining protein MreC
VNLLVETLQKRVAELETENQRLREDVRRYENSRRIQASENAYWRERAGFKNTHPDAARNAAALIMFI